MPDELPEDDAPHIHIEVDDASDLELKLHFWSALNALRRRHGIDATWALIAEFMPKRAANRPRDPDGQIAKRLQLTYELRDRTWRETGEQLTLTAAAKQIEYQSDRRFRSLVNSIY
jgi:hypothetical protein